MILLSAAPVRAFASRRLLGFLLLGALGGCSSLPSSGPTADAITAASRNPKAPPGFRIVALTPEVVAQTGQRPGAPIDPAHPLSEPGEVDAIGPGDVLQISIFEIGAALFSGRSGAAAAAAGQAGGEPSPPSAAGEVLPAIMVGRDGSISLPYVGRIHATGLTPQDLATRIEAGLAGKSQAPQVVVSVSNNLANSVVVMGDVKKPGRIVLSLAREHVLDAIALAGGLSNPTPDNIVRLQRGAASIVLPMGDVHAGSPEDVTLLPQDRIEVSYQPRSFSVFGATGKVQEIPFQNPRVSLAEALARAGGPSDQLADPSAVFVFRYEPSGTDGAPAPGARPVAYRLDLLQAQSYFVAQAFEMKTRDVIYIANARSNQPAKLLQILNLFFQPFYTGKVLTQ